MTEDMVTPIKGDHIVITLSDDLDVIKIAKTIIGLQKNNGAIVEWSNSQNVHVWNHIESLMALSTVGLYDNVKKGFDWLISNQQPDGSWVAETKHPLLVQPHFVAYFAVGLWHYYLCSGDIESLKNLWRPLEKAIQFTCSAQNKHGQFSWAKKDAWESTALLTANCSIYKSLECAIAIANQLHKKKPSWSVSKQKLFNAINYLDPETWLQKEQYAMDWFYPVLMGCYSIEKSLHHIQSKWQKFVVDNLGCKCVVDQPWVTIAETSELIMALIRVKFNDQAVRLFEKIRAFQHPSGSFWMGYNYEQHVLWPNCQPTWTSAAIILAYDAIHNGSKGHGVFLYDQLEIEKESLKNSSSYHKVFG